jgi:hypothetical protein
MSALLKYIGLPVGLSSALPRLIHDYRISRIVRSESVTRDLSPFRAEPASTGYKVHPYRDYACYCHSASFS